MKVGIIGYGVIGSAMGKWIEENTTHGLAIVDPALDYNDDITDCNVIFISVPVLNENGIQNDQILRDILKKIPKHIPVFIRSTVLPGTCDRLSKEYQMKRMKTLRS